MMQNQTPETDESYEEFQPEWTPEPPPEPSTIEELRAWYIAHRLPPEDVTRFFIGRNIHEPRAFGIYREDDRFIVYKNKADGSRAVRYYGPDEAYAVNELYQRLKQEIGAQKGRNAEERAIEQKKNSRSSRIAIAIAVLISAAVLVYCFWSEFNSPSRGYYRYEDDWYYYQSGLWYTYGDEWERCDQAPAWTESYNDYYQYTDYNGSYNYTDFSLTDYYSTTDSDSSWSSDDSWDSGSTDWDSDW